MFHMQPKTSTTEADRHKTTESILPNEKFYRVHKSSDQTSSKMSMMKNRSIQENEVTILSGPVHIEDRSQAEKGNILLKARWAVLCSSRLLLFKNERHTLRGAGQGALAVYPLNESNFELRRSAALTPYNFQKIKPFED